MPTAASEWYWASYWATGLSSQVLQSSTQHYLFCGWNMCRYGDILLAVYLSKLSKDYKLIRYVEDKITTGITQRGSLFYKNNMLLVASLILWVIDGFSFSNILTEQKVKIVIQVRSTYCA